jgi:serine protease Do
MASLDDSLFNCQQVDSPPLCLLIPLYTMISGGLALAVPSKAVQRFLRDMARPQLGVTLRPVLAELGRERPKKRKVLGLLVLDVAFNSLAMAAGLKPGDVLVGICGQHFHTPDDLRERAVECRTGGIAAG